MKAVFRRILTLFLAFLLLCGSFACADETGFERLAGLRAGAVDGSLQYKFITENIKDPVLLYFDSETDEAIALRQGKIDFYLAVPQTFALMTQEYPDLAAVPGLSIPMGSIGFCFAKTEHGKYLCDQMNVFLAELRESGELEEIQSYWFCAGEKENIDLPANGANGTLSFVTTAHLAPFEYVQNGGLTGYEIDLLARFCERFGYCIRYEIANVAGSLASVQSGKSDIGAGCYIATEERLEVMNFSDSTLDLAYSIIMRRADAGVSEEENTGSAETGTKSFFSRLRDSFQKTFIKEDRWRLILQGLGTTAAMTLLSSFFGNLLGLGLCLLKRRKHRTLNAVLGAAGSLISGTPIVVLLMILYYILFGSLQLSGFAVAVIAFSLNTAVGSAEIFRTSIEAIDFSQTEAAPALGYNGRQAFRKFILPQAAQSFVPLLQGQTVALLKGTAVVGYIAVQDLTKMGDIIRSRTYEAFFPLIATAVIYLLLTWGIGFVFSRVQRRKHRWKTV